MREKFYDRIEYVTGEDVTDTERELVDLFLPYYKKDPSMDKENSIVGTIIAVSGENFEDEIIELVKDNKDKPFKELLDLIWTRERFPSLEIVDDDELNEEDREN